MAQQVSWKFKLFMLGLFSLAYAVFYIYPNFFPSFQPYYLPLWRVDHWVPFLPWTFLIYLSDYLLIALVIVMINDMPRFRSFSRVCFFTLIMCGTFFLFFPTRYPRPHYPEVDNLLIAFFMGLVKHLDTPNNCFPSMHVAITGTATWCLRFKGPKVFLLFFLWAIAIFMSTLTTKQHYFVDVLGGISIVVVVGFIEWFVFSRDFLKLNQWVAKRSQLPKPNA